MSTTTTALADLTASMTDLATLRRDSIASLNRALRRFERMASPPRHLQYPIVGDLHAVERAASRAFERGDIARGEELAELVHLETVRIGRALSWRDGKRRRSRIAWQALADRLARAIDWAIRTGALTGDSVVFAADRQRECVAQVRHHDTLAALARLN
ncbi:MAG TPA: hypothetical protein VJZ73_13430 [Methylomirabilota bacterium]|nr:hypothetical protein [Methylomirabilota bacterium]